ncbi:MAG: PDZ domain-containing protein [Campylobacteraceae bacterium]|jgi:type II secretion system protein C|nr:PDZ domain-containing protein [Campylobacteraceae bacterium]
MNRLFNSKSLNLALKILICVVIAKGIALIFFIFLPKSGIDANPDEKDIINFNSYNQPSSFSGSSQDSSASQFTQLGNLKLLAIYKENNDKTAFVVIGDGSSSEVLKVGDTYKQYRVNRIKSDSVSLLENGREVWLGFAKSTLNLSASPKTPVTSNRFSNLITGRTQIQSAASLQPNQEEYVSVLKRSEVDEFMANPDAIFKNIGFKEVMKDGKIDGFRVLSINRNSPLAKLGIRTGDIIQSFNGIRLDNYSSVLEIYDKIKSYSRVKLEVMRNNEKKEFEYEIY